MRRHLKASSAAPIQTADSCRARLGFVGLMTIGFVAFLGIGAPSASAIDTCPNVVFRTGPSAKLPECRAYELVTPAYTGGTPPTFQAFAESVPGMFATDTVTPQGDSVVYHTYNGALSGFSGTGFVDRYRARRTALGWVTESISPGGDMRRNGSPGGISSDHEYSTESVSEPTAKLGPAFAGYSFLNILRTPDGYEPLAEGSLGVATDYEDHAYWITAKGTHVIFGARKKLEPAAAELSGGGTNIYDRSPGGPTHVVSLLPDGTSSPNGVTFAGATRDGTEVAFNTGIVSGQGALYVRRDNAVTKEVFSGGFTFDGIFNHRVFYSDASRGNNYPGTFGNLYMYDLEEEETTTIEGDEDASIVNVSEDGSHVYFVAHSALTGSEQNQYGKVAIAPAKGTGTLTEGSREVTGVNTSEGTFQPGMAITGPGTREALANLGPTITAVGPGTLTLSQKASASGPVSLSADAPNLYVWSRADESTKFIGTVAPADVETIGQNKTASINTWAKALATAEVGATVGRAVNHTRSTPDGTVFAFETTAALSGFDNTEENAADCGGLGAGGVPVPGQPCDEVYRYDANSAELTCVSCGPGTGPASGEARLQSSHATGEPGGVAPATANSPVESLTADGSMVFFESTEGLVPQDGNETKDVYRWKEGAGVALISSGQDVGESALYGVTPNGSDAIFGTREKLLPQDENGTTVRLYDARVNGGFPPPEETVTEPCSGDACQGQAAAAPEPPNVSSSSLSGQGNVAAKLRCAKHSRRVIRKGRESCRRKHTHRRRAHHKRRAAR